MGVQTKIFGRLSAPGCLTVQSSLGNVARAMHTSCRVIWGRIKLKAVEFAITSRSELQHRGPPRIAVLIGLARAIGIHVIVTSATEQLFAILVDEFVQRLTAHHSRVLLHAVWSDDSQHSFLIVHLGHPLQILGGKSIIVIVQITDVGLVHDSRSTRAQIATVTLLG